ncbi:MAG: DNA-directed RNA polymerase subunit H [Candidatus Bathyarchaeia archaeon]
MKREDKQTYNVLNHALVPRHILLTEEEAEELLKKYHVKPYQLPYIKVSDPAAKAVGAKPGDIIKIVRRSPTAGEAIAYRYAVED